MVVTVEIPETILASADLSAADVLIELGLSLYASQRLTLEESAELARLTPSQFRQIAGERGIGLQDSAFAKQLDTFIDQYRPALEALAR